MIKLNFAQIGFTEGLLGFLMNPIFPDKVRVENGIQSGYVSITAAAEASQVTIPSGASFVIATSDTATKVVIMPEAVIGTVIKIVVPATGAELQTAVAGSDTINGVDCSGANEMAMAAGSVYTLVCAKANAWIATGVGADGAAQATIVPDTDA